MRKRVSIVIPTYNEEHYLAACLQAIAAQTVRPHEVIIVDNNSRDNTVAIAKQFPFATIVHEPRQGLFYARNTGMDAATGSVIARIDADTIVEHDWVATITDAFADPEISAISGPVGYHDMPLPAFCRRAENALLLMAKAGKYDFLMGANMAVSRKAWHTIRHELCNKPFLLEDIDIAIHLMRHEMYPAYSTAMLAHVSARRMADKPKDFLRYINGHTRTWHYHGLQPSIGSYYASSMFTFVYFGIKPLHMAFDPGRRRFSLAYARRRIEARPDPMATKYVDIERP
ncbi:MAG TPA: glycosyltransferase family 2 protein [Candidatus Saccharimonadales bacterium]|nr:glycosyltransferase family 2 protein [Candidatus Saccharimonadales bacterium]